MPHYSIPSVNDRVIHELQLLERSIRSDAPVDLGGSRLLRYIAIHQAKFLCRAIIAGDAPSWPTTARADRHVRQRLIRLKMEVDGNRRDEVLAILFAELVVETIDSIRAANGCFERQV
jgi:hypothetical protein